MRSQTVCSECKKRMITLTYVKRTGSKFKPENISSNKIFTSMKICINEELHKSKLKRVYVRDLNGYELVAVP